MKNNDKEESKLNVKQSNNQNLWIGCPTNSHPQQGEYVFDDFIIDSKFDEGNIMDVQKTDVSHVKILF